MRTRGFTLIELMTVVVMIGIVAAVSVPGIREIAARAEGDRALRESALAVAGARDSARGRGVCLDYIVRASGSPPVSYPPPITVMPPGPYSIDIWVVSCPGDPSVAPQRITTRTVSPTVSQVRMFVSGDRQTDRIHFARDGSLYDPTTPVKLEATINNVVQRFTIYPAAGTIELDSK